MSGQKIILRPITMNDTKNVVRWRNNKSVKCNLFDTSDISCADHIFWMNNFVMKRKCVQFVIELKETQESIGTVFIKNIDVENDKGEFGIFIGEDKYRGKGYGNLATELILEYAFNELKLNRVYLSVLANNIPGIKSYLKAGFTKEGTLKQDYKRDNRYFDVIIMSVLNEEWMELRK